MRREKLAPGMSLREHVWRAVQSLSVQHSRGVDVDEAVAWVGYRIGSAQAAAAARANKTPGRPDLGKRYLVRRALNRLVDKGFLVRMGSGLYGANEMKGGVQCRRK